MHSNLSHSYIDDAFTVRTLLLVASRENRRLLVDCLEEDYAVEAPEPFSAAGRAALETGEWDLCIADGPVLSEYWKQVKSRKMKDDDEFVPFLLVTSHQRVKSTTRQLWRLVDEVILAPIEKEELHARIEVLLRAQRYPRRWSERYTALAEMAPVGILSLDSEGVISYANAQAESVLEDGQGPPVGRSAESWHATDFEGRPLSVEELPFYRVARRHQTIQNMQLAIERENGERTLLSINGAPLFDDAGQLDSVLCSIADVTERERRVRELRAAKEEAEAMNRLKTSFLANMSHEIRTPLNGILGFADMLVEEADDEQREAITYIQKSGERLLATLTAILEFSQLESGALEVHPSRFDAAAELDKLCRPFAAQASTRDLDFEFASPDHPVDVYLDRAILTSITTNLLSNAVKFTQEGGIVVTLEPDAEQLILTVADTGAGIGEDFLPEIFEPFRQESSGIGRQFEGSGLGLAITKKLVELLKGTIDVETCKDAGTVFRLALPRYVDAPRDGDGDESAHGRSPSPRPR